MGLPTEEWKAQGMSSEAEPDGNPEARVKKHVPVVTVDGGKAKVAVHHGMEADHWIQAVWIEADGKPVAEHEFAPTDAPEAELDIPADAAEITAFSMCNLHHVYASPATPIDAGEVKLIALGSCRKQSLPAPVWDAVLSLRPDAWLWTGDAVYPRPNASPDELRGAYHKAAADDSRVRSAVRVYDGVYDDHDFGLNDAGRTFGGREVSRQIFLDEIVRAPADSVRRTQPGGLYGSRTLGRPPRQMKLILLDTRFSRDDHAIPSVGGSSWIPKPGYAAAAVRLASAALGIGSAYEGDVLGREQWEWLRTELTNSSAAVHLIVSSIQVGPARMTRGTPWQGARGCKHPSTTRKPIHPACRSRPCDLHLRIRGPRSGSAHGCAAFLPYISAAPVIARSFGCPVPIYPTLPAPRPSSRPNVIVPT
jgi:desulfoferrodoxin (superoxide reductase-like protein)